MCRGFSVVFSIPQSQWDILGDLDILLDEMGGFYPPKIGVRSHVSSEPNTAEKQTCVHGTQMTNQLYKNTSELVRCL